MLLPRIVAALAPALAPAGLLSFLASLVLFGWMSLSAASQSGVTFEAGAMAFAAMGFALTCLTLAWLDRVSGSRLPPASVVTQDIGEELG